MALFTDGPVSSIEDMIARDSQLLTVANVEGIDVTQKITLAQDEVALELGIMLSRLSYIGQPVWTTPLSTINNVVVTPALKLWHTLHALELVYCDAYNNELNDRYAGKRDQFHQMADWAHDKLVQTGVGIVTVPVSRPAVPKVTAETPPTGAPLADGTYYVTTSWTGREGEEGCTAAPTVVTIVSSTFAVQPGTAPANATGWNVYVGMTPDSVALQNDTPLAADATWVQPGVLVAGRLPGSGQSPSFIKQTPQVIQRG